MGETETRPVVRPVTAHGWLRRPGLDTQTCEAWELPNGKMFAARRHGGVPVIVTFPWQDVPKR